MKENQTKISVIVPVFNEQESADRVVKELKNEMDGLGIIYEIIAVNDGSSDASHAILKKIEGIKLIKHPYNKGYGASLKTGVQHAQYEWLLFFDSDGQHKTEYIREFLRHADQYDLVIGCRQGYKGPLVRQPGKKIIHWLANYLAETKIPDLNCGFRLIKKEHFLRYKHLFPNNFSLSTTSTLAFLKEGLSVKYLPLTINKREGRSSLKISDGFKTLLLALRLIMLFSPLKIFLPISFAGFLISAYIIITVLIATHFDTISKSGGFLFVSSLLIFLFGLLADQVAAIRRELKK
jgi:glycosyltransferase involved in cell wall biosynthesis